MPPLPPEALHLPFEAGPYRMAMGLVTVPDSAWFEIDALYPAEVRERRRMLREHHGEVFAALPGSTAAASEAAAEIATHLAGQHPAWFDYEGTNFHNRLTGEAVDLAALDGHPLELAGRMVQEDLCLIADSPDGPLLLAAVLCFPSRWRLAEKIGRPLVEVHGPVPFYGERLARPVDRFMRMLKPGHVVARLNWSVLDDPALFQPAGKWRQVQNSAVTADNAGETLFLRVERQTLRLLHQTGAVLFGIRVHVYPLARAITNSADAARLAEAVWALPDTTAHYKSLPPIRDALLGWLDARAT